MRSIGCARRGPSPSARRGRPSLSEAPTVAELRDRLATAAGPRGPPGGWNDSGRGQVILTAQSMSNERRCGAAGGKTGGRRGLPYWSCLSCGGVRAGRARASAGMMMIATMTWLIDKATFVAVLASLVMGNAKEPIRPIVERARKDDRGRPAHRRHA